MFYMVLNQKTHRRNDCLFNTNYIHLLIFITKIHLYLQLASSKSWRKSSFITITATKRILEREIILYSISLLDLQKNHFISHASMVRLFLLWFLLCFFFLFSSFFHSYVLNGRGRLSTCKSHEGLMLAHNGFEHHGRFFGHQQGPTQAGPHPLRMLSSSWGGRT